MEERKSLVLALLEILTHDSDENHILIQSEIRRLLQERYDMDIERRTLTSNIKLLQNFGYDINDYSQNGKGYYLVDRQFEKSEINLLCHSIHASSVIPEKASQDLINKLLTTQSKATAREFNNRVYSKNYRKSKNPEFFLNIELLLEAVNNNKEISFTYTQYNHHKERVPRREEKYYLYPYDVVYSNERFYLIGHNKKYDQLSHYRIDKMQGIKMLDNSFTRRENFNCYEYSQSKIYMYSGEELSILIRCNDVIIDDVLDTFGLNTFIQKEDGGTFIARVSSSEQGIIFWAMQYVENCTILEPKQVKDKVKNILKNALTRYN